MNIGFYGYLGAAIAYGILGFLLVFSWRASLQGTLLTGTVFLSAVWAGLAANIAHDGAFEALGYRAFEVVRYLAWYVFLLKLFDTAAARNKGYRRFLRWALPLSAALASLFLVYVLFVSPALPGLQMPGYVFLSIIGLAIIEQLFRNTADRQRWAIKYLFIGAGGIFAFDFFLYVDAVLFGRTDPVLWEARSIVNMLAVPLLAIAAARNRDWSLNVFVSRDIVLHTTALAGGALYLLAMAGVGYYLRDYGGSWGRVSQVALFAVAVGLLAAVLFSGQLRARARVFVGKHFYQNKYDYRHEWLRLTGELMSNKEPGEKRFEAVIPVLGQVVDARAGLLWLCDDEGRYRNTAAWNANRIDVVEDREGTLVQFLQDTAFVINLTEFESRAEEYRGLQLPVWLTALDRPWLIVPLFGLHGLLGFVVLANPLVARSINWEDRDLLKTAAKQIASHLDVLMTSEALAEAKQFEVFNRLSAYMVHDLKNIAAELAMVARNAAKHKHNPAFLEDAFATVDDAARNINRLLTQMRNRRIQTESKRLFDLGKLVQEVVATKQHQISELRLDTPSEDCFVVAERGRLANVLGHLIDNAQQATGQGGMIEVTLASKDAVHIIEIRDNGHGMDAEFIRNRLFKPFDTTKGNAGLGIGMYESREFVRELGGDMHVQSEPGKGTTVALHLPASTEHSALVSVNA